MAVLVSQSMVLEILPLQPEFDKEDKWIQTRFALQIQIPGQKLTIRPSEDITVLYEDLVMLHEGIEQFAQRLQSLTENQDPLAEITEPYEFVPLELDFEISCLNGEISDRGEGEVTMRVMANLGVINQHLSSEYIGCTTNVRAQSLLEFLDHLKREIQLCFQSS